MKSPSVFLGLFALFVLVSCSKDDGPAAITAPAKSSAKQITSFVFKAADNEKLDVDIIGVIDQGSKTINAKVPYSTDVSALKPEVSYSVKAKIGSLGVTDFSAAVSYEITAEDGSKTVYVVTITELPNNENQIAVFQFLLADNPLETNVIGEIDHEAGTISFDVPDGADITALLPSMQLPEGASISPQGVQNFKEDVVYTVTAANGTTTAYKVITNYSQRGVLIEIHKANPENSQGWDLDNPDIGNWNGVTIDSENRIIDLYLAGNKYLQTLPAEIKHLKHLTVLHLVGTGQGGGSLSSIPKEIGELTNLKFLDVSRNRLTEIPKEIGQLSNLEILNLRRNKLTQIPPEIVRLTSLEELNLGRNQLTELPSEIGQLAQLKELNLTLNSLTELPEDIGKLMNLEVLSLPRNQLSSLPGQIGALTKLRVFQLEVNPLTELPVEIEKLTNLESLDLQETKLVELPEQIGSLTSLVYLDISKNQLVQLPKEMGNLSNLTNLVLSENQLTSLPIELGNLTQLHYIHLTKNPIVAIPQAICDLQDTGTSLFMDDNVRCE